MIGSAAAKTIIERQAHVIHAVVLRHEAVARYNTSLRNCTGCTRYLLTVISEGLPSVSDDILRTSVNIGGVHIDGLALVDRSWSRKEDALRQHIATAILYGVGNRTTVTSLTVNETV